MKYKTEMCRNWELTGYCEFMDSVSIFLLRQHTNFIIYSVPLPMEITNCNLKLMYLKTIKLDYAKDFMKIYIVPMV